MGSKSGFILRIDSGQEDGRAPQPDLAPGAVVDGRFAIHGVLGRGGFSWVYAAEQTSMGREVALKVLRQDQSANEPTRKRFLREVRAVAALSNPHTVSVFDVGSTADGILYIAMELLKGTSLQQAMQREGGPMPVQRAVQIVDQVLDSLDEAHAAGILHRDLKPDNIFLVPSASGNDFVKVLDFGIAGFVDDTEERDPDAGVPVGTPRYMSPEQIEAKRLDARTDLYSLATILFEMLAGRPPFDAPSPVDLALAKTRDEPPPLRQAAPGVRIPDEVEMFLQRALSKDPDERPASAAEFRNLLLIALEEEGTKAQAEAARAWATRPPEPHTAPAAATEPPLAEAPKPAPAKQDRRRARRELRTLSVVFLLHGHLFKATSVDLSGIGGFFHSRFIPPVGARLAMIFSASGEPGVRRLLSADVVRASDVATGPGQVRGFAVTWVIPAGLPQPKRFGEVFDILRKSRSIPRND
jgi:tRNA A-37 threonylcarbamoyl transferase component Bud32